jgi:hypothetical protein
MATASLVLVLVRVKAVCGQGRPVTNTGYHAKAMFLLSTSSVLNGIE